ncbi:S8 family serine peptidase [Alkalispirillum mobile]|uniref:S8 family serine peptidase n=1 Tax=Alkalispirillum mobile TaxID=85925 RepID=UPI003CCC6525
MRIHRGVLLGGLGLALALPVPLTVATAEPGAQAGDAPSADWAGQSAAPGELLVVRRDEAVAAGEHPAAVHSAVGASIARRLLGGRAEHVRLPPSADMEAIMRLYADDPSVEWVEPNYRVYSASIPDPEPENYGEQWALQAINVEEAWEETTGSEDVLVGLLDTKVDTEHPDLQQNLAEPIYPDCANTSNFGGRPELHGTHLAGTIGAQGIGVAGVNQEVSLLNYVVLESEGDGQTARGTISDIVCALEQAAADGVRVINASFTTSRSETLKTAIADAAEDDVLVVAAAGNSGEELDYEGAGTGVWPASYRLSNVIAVAASTEDDELASFSNFGRNDIELAAPGNLIIGTVPEDRYERLSGTSMAVPHVVGAAALILAEHGADETSYREVRERLLASVRDGGSSTDWASVTKAGGILDVGRAVTAAIDDVPALAPSDLRLEREDGSSEIALSWINNSTQVDDLWLEHCTGFECEEDASDFERIESLSLSSGDTDAQHEPPAPIKPSYNAYRVCAVKGLNPEVACSAPRALAVPPTAPSSVEAIAIGGQVAVRWQDNSAVEEAFRVYERDLSDNENDAEWKRVATTDENVEQATVPLPDEGEYRYAVCAFAEVSGCSEFATASDTVVVSDDDSGNGSSSSGSSSSGCFIATAAWGSEWDDPVAALREFRDEELLTTQAGQELVSLYYHFSPVIADWVAEDDERRARVREWVAPLAALAEQALEQRGEEATEAE